MTRLVRTLGVVALVVLALGAAGCGREGSGPLELTGSVTDDVTVLKAPSIPTPSPLVEIESLSREGTPTPQMPKDERGVHDPLWLRVEDVAVNVGDSVTEGDVLVTLDASLLEAAVSSAEADAARSRADLALLGGRLDEVEEGLDDIATQRSELETAVAELEEQRDEILVQLEAARKLVGAPVPTGTPDPAVTVVELETAIEGIDEGLEEAREGLNLLDDTGGQLGQAVASIEGAEKAARALVRGRDAVVEIAEAYLAMATLRAPEDGIIVETPRVGNVLAPEAPLVGMRPRRATTIKTWITAEQREQIALGASARVVSDSMPEAVTGAVSDIGTVYSYAPTNFATKIIHMNRAFEVTIIVYGDDTPPPGTPVDITVETLARLGS